MLKSYVEAGLRGKKNKTLVGSLRRKKDERKWGGRQKKEKAKN